MAAWDADSIYLISHTNRTKILILLIYILLHLAHVVLALVVICALITKIPLRIPHINLEPLRRTLKLILIHTLHAHSCINVSAGINHRVGEVILRLLI